MILHNLLKAAKCALFKTISLTLTGHFLKGIVQYLLKAVPGQTFPELNYCLQQIIIQITVRALTLGEADDQLNRPVKLLL